MTTRERLINDIVTAWNRNKELSQLIEIWHAEGVARSGLWLAYCSLSGIRPWDTLCELRNCRRVSRRLHIAATVVVAMVNETTRQGRLQLASQLQQFS